MSDPKLLCVPVNEERSLRSAGVAVKSARQVARALINQKKRQLSKARGQLARIGGAPPEVLAGIQFRQSSSLGEGLTSPYGGLDFTKISDGFYPSQGLNKLDDSFIAELLGSAKKANAAVFIEHVAGVSRVTKSAANTPNALTPEWLSATVTQTVVTSDVSGAWLIYRLPSNSFKRYMCIRYGEGLADFRKAQTLKYSLKKTNPTTPLRVIFTGNQTPSFEGENQHRYFTLPAGVAGIDPSNIQRISMTGGLIHSDDVSLVQDPQRPYGPEFNAIRPPGAPNTMTFAYFSENIEIRHVVAHYNKLLGESWVAIKNDLVGQDLEKFLHYYPAKSSLHLHSGMFSRQSSTLWLGLAALSNPIYQVDSLALDVRPDSAGEPAGHSIIDTGPFGAARGLLASGKPLVTQATRPSNKKFDNRVGSMVIKHDDEALGPSVIQIGPFSDLARSTFFRDIGLESLLKLEYIAQMRVVSALNLVYRPFNDFATVAALYRFELGKFLVDSYVDNKDTMLDSISSASVNANIPNSVFKETWGTLAIRSLLGFKYSTIPSLPNFFGTEEKPANADRLLPLSTPSDENKISLFGDVADPNLGGQIDFKNYASPNVPAFTVGTHGMFRSDKIQKIILHWGGTQRGHLIDDGGAISAMLSRKDHVASTHFTITHDGLSVRQHADLIMAAYHAKGHNNTSIGIDMPTLGALRSSYGPRVRPGYLVIGYEVIDSPFCRTDMLIGRPQMYETTYLLIKSLISLNNPPQGVHTDQVNISDTPMGIFDDNGKTALVTNVMDSGTEKGIGAHLHVAGANGKIDGIDGYIYYALRSHLDDTAEQAFRRMKLTLSSAVKRDAQGRRYLILDRS